MKLRSDYSIPKVTIKERQYKALPALATALLVTVYNKSSYRKIIFGKRLKSAE